MTEDRLQEVIEELRSQLGERIIIQMDEDPLDVEVIPTGSLAVDKALGIGGVPRGRITEIFGPHGGGKTTLGIHLVAECQRMGGVANYIDMEHAVDLQYMQACGVDTKQVLFSQPDSGTDALNVIRKLVSENVVDLIVLDSVAALTSAAELDADAADHFVGIQARMMSQNLKAIVPPLGLSDVALVFINQTRMKIGTRYGNPETTPGGKALKFYSSVRMRVAQRGKLGKQSRRYGILTSAKTYKNKCAPPWQEAQFEILWGKGIDKAADTLRVAYQAKVVTLGGGFYYFRDEKISEDRGKVPAIKRLREDPDILREIRAAVLNGEEEDADDSAAASS